MQSLHFTDPRYWRWLYEMEAELRQNIPILFYHIWDDLPDPHYNRNYYESHVIGWDVSQNKPMV